MQPTTTDLLKTKVLLLAHNKYAYIFFKIGKKILHIFLSYGPYDNSIIFCGTHCIYVVLNDMLIKLVFLWIKQMYSFLHKDESRCEKQKNKYKINKNVYKMIIIVKINKFGYAYNKILICCKTALLILAHYTCIHVY